MQIKINRNIPFFPRCLDEISGKECVNNGKVCECNIYAGDATKKNMFEGK